MKSYNKSISYRSEIDGLRAIAILPVILFHAGFSLFSGGYLGVDVFFVISGYLITTIIINELSEKNFRLINFYERRARRILPALFFVLIVCIIFSFSFLLPSDFASFSKSVISVVAFSSNFLFWKESGYFDLEAEFKPLLHTWSLAVEEQYYIIFPIFILIFIKFGMKFIFYSLIFIFLLSLALASFGSMSMPVASFYLLPTRGWEILLGSICAYLVHFKIKIKRKKFINLFSFIGFFLILISMFTFDENTPTPSPYTLIPTSGAALIILFASKGTIVNSILSFKPLVGIGLISYSTYLWHQPIFSFFKIVIPQQELIQTNYSLIMISLSILSLLFGWLSWRFIERPFRIKTTEINKSNNKRGKKFLLNCFLIMIFFSIFSYTFVKSKGYPDRLSKEITMIAMQENDKSPYKDSCQIEDGTIIHPLKECTDFLINNKAEVIFVGDSHSNAISYQSQRLLFEKNISSYSVSYNACIGLEGFYTVTKPSNHDCDKYNKDILEYAREVEADTLVITSRFPLYISGERFNNTRGGIEFGEPLYIDTIENKNTGYVSFADDMRKKRVLKRIKSQIYNILDEFNVVMVYPIPEMGWNIPREMAKCKIMKAFDCNFDYPIDVFFERSKDTSILFNNIKNHNFIRVFPSEVICNKDKEICSGIIDNKLLYYDDDHLSNSNGSNLLAPKILKAVRQSKNL